MKDNNKEYPCKECGKVCYSLSGLVNHIRRNHDKKYKDYYDKWILKDNDNLCKICKKESIFISIGQGYRSGCCKDHMNKWNHIQIKKGVQEKYGVDNIFQVKSTIDKIQNTCLERYGVKHTHQNPDILNKALLTGLRIKKYKNSNLFYQGTHELDFLNKYFDKIKDLKNGLSIKYVYKNKERVYHADFYSPNLNLIIECKSTYWLNIHKEKVASKKEATLKKGYNYIMTLDKNYFKIDEILSRQL